MANQETQILDEIIVSNRRKMLALGGAALAGLAFAGVTSASAQSAAPTDADVLNFALNLEYLEANFYNLAVSGQTIDQLGIGIGAGTAATGGGAVTTKPGGPTACKVAFALPQVKAYAIETAAEESKHVTLLRSALSTSAVAQPPIDLYNSFNTLGALIGVPNFDPFASDAFFLVGAYIFEDVGVTAYSGAAGLISTNSTLVTAAGILAVEAYHAGLVRTTIFQVDPTNSAGYLGITQKISALRNKLDLSATPDDYGIMATVTALNGTNVIGGGYSVVDANLTTSLAFSRTTSQVLAIVTGGTAGAYKGVFFPSGLNGNVK
ncbi:ferritin-like domain-containing protein [Granulicella tundricola]|uniref:Dessication-associated protein n=1 Tax=Granulicella tundricola (strain ATCC BAA-1859 / DSM 23138 / MP5ACTX9) TaxID=1198114 RepID=E8X5M4_GRATM|nr:ferritin-like domain-containing protein [Granulicella tundricola]ADW70651.1 hypothetical protein AciX9_3648 [Granulicella tundricola MP5ACTX9]